jgi:hypothetical protein
MTDEKADELAKLALELENQRNDLKKIYCEKVREQHGGFLAAGSPGGEAAPHGNRSPDCLFIIDCE